MARSHRPRRTRNALDSDRRKAESALASQDRQNAARQRTAVNTENTYLAQSQQYARENYPTLSAEMRAEAVRQAEFRRAALQNAGTSVWATSTEEALALYQSQQAAEAERRAEQQRAETAEASRREEERAADERSAYWAARSASDQDRSKTSNNLRTENPMKRRTPNHHRTGLIGQDYPIDPYRSDLDKAYDPYDRDWRTGNPAAKPTKYYRGGGEGMDSIPRDISVWDVVVFEREELGNGEGSIVPLFSEEILRKIPASRTQWLARTRKGAQYYGRAEAMTYRDPVELVEDNQDGCIVIERQAFDYYTSGARSENPAPAHQDPNTEGLKRLRLFFDGDYTRFSPKSEWKVGIVDGRPAAVHKRTGSLIEPLWAPKGGLRYHAVLVEDDGRHKGLSEDKTVEAVYNDIVAALYGAGRARNPSKPPAIPNLKVGDIVTVQDASNWSTAPYERRVLKVMKTRFDVGGVGPFDAYTLMQITSGRHGLESTVVAVNGVPVRGRTPKVLARVRNGGLGPFDLYKEFAEEIRTMADRHSVLHKYAPALHKIALSQVGLAGDTPYEQALKNQVLCLWQFLSRHLLPDVAAAVGCEGAYDPITSLPPAADRGTFYEVQAEYGACVAPHWRVQPPDREASRALDKRLEQMDAYAHEALRQAALAREFLERYERAVARGSAGVEAMVSNEANLRAFRELPIVAAYAVESAALARVPLKVLERAMREGL